MPLPRGSIDIDIRVLRFHVIIIKRKSVGTGEYVPHFHLAHRPFLHPKFHSKCRIASRPRKHFHLKFFWSPSLKSHLPRYELGTPSSWDLNWRVPSLNVQPGQLRPNMPYIERMLGAAESIRLCKMIFHSWATHLDRCVALTPFFSRVFFSSTLRPTVNL